MDQGRLDIGQFGTWYRDIEYISIKPPIVGFNPTDPRDLDRYSVETMLGWVGLDVPDNVKQYCQQSFPCTADHWFSVQLMQPATILPLHTDTYSRYSTENQCTVDKIRRIIVFLEDWQSGHISEVDQNPITNWRKGDWISWTGSTEHMAANIGHRPRYTLQITTRITND
jgi:hypothetical protein